MLYHNNNPLSTNLSAVGWSPNLSAVGWSPYSSLTSSGG